MIKVDDKFLNYFRKEAETVSKTTAFWDFYRIEKGNRICIKYFLLTIDKFINIFPFLSIEEVCIPYVEAIFKENQTIHRFTNTGEISYQEWENYIFKHYDTNAILLDDSSIDNGEHFVITVNYLVETELQHITGLYYGNGFGITISINFYFLEESDSTYISFFIQCRGEPFYEYPWGIEYPNFYLPREYVYHNRKVLRESMQKMETEGFEIKSYGFEWGDTHINWSIDKHGFVDKEY